MPKTLLHPVVSGAVSLISVDGNYQREPGRIGFALITFNSRCLDFKPRALATRVRADHRILPNSIRVGLGLGEWRANRALGYLLFVAQGIQ